MSICVRDGIPGSGKSYSAVQKDIVPALKRGRLVVTNIPMNRKPLERVIGKSTEGILEVLENEWETSVNPKTGKQVQTEVRAFSRQRHWQQFECWENDDVEYKGEGPLYVVDECHEVIHRDEMGVDELKDLADWFAVHRKKGIDIVLVTQAGAELPPGFRRRWESRYRYKQLGAVGLKSFFVEAMFHGDDTKTVLKTRYGRYDKSVFALYRSMDDGRMSTAGTSIQSLFRSPVFMLVLAFITYSIYNFWNNGFSIPNTGGAEAVAGETTEQQNAGAENGEAIASGSATARENGNGALNQIAQQGLTLGQNSQSQPNQVVADLQQPSYDHPLDMYRVQISSAITMNGDTTFHIVGERNGVIKRWRQEQFVSMGYELIPLGACGAFVHRPGYPGWELSCYHETTIGK